MLNDRVQISDADIDELEQSEGWVFDEERRNILKSLDTIDVQACPGSGKTTLIAAKLILLAQKWPNQASGICVLSHTNVAKNEIVNRLKNSKAKEAQTLLSYPHFIGTLQEFAGKYIAFPSMRSEGVSINAVDDEVCVQKMQSRLRRGTKTYLSKKGGLPDVLFGFKLNFSDGDLQFQVPGFKAKSDSPSYSDLLSVRTDLLCEGYMFFHDVFAIAMLEVSSNQTLNRHLRQRFALVFIDEMQDTQAHQDNLISSIFCSGDEESKVQRFGDPDQAIFNGMSTGEVANTSYNDKSRDEMHFVIDRSHRFDEGICTLLRPFSHNSIILESDISKDTLEARRATKLDGQGFEHTILLYDDVSILHVVDAFIDQLKCQFSERYLNSESFTAKVVGAVGKELDPDPDKTQLRICSFWPEFNKSKNRNNFKPQSLFEVIEYVRHSDDLDFKLGYDLIFESIVKLSRLQGLKDKDKKDFTKTNLKKWLRDKGDWSAFQEHIYEMMTIPHGCSEREWDELTSKICFLLEIDDLTDSAIGYIQLNRDNGEDNIERLVIANTIDVNGDFKVELSTIHQVKGETHDATLVLETYLRRYDLGSLTPQVGGNFLRTNAEKARNAKFQRQIYVAASRARHLVCLAIHKERVTAGDQVTFRANGWDVKEVEVPQNA